MVFFVTFLANGLWLEARSRSPSVFNGLPLVIVQQFNIHFTLFSVCVAGNTHLLCTHIISHSFNKNMQQNYILD